MSSQPIEVATLLGARVDQVAWIRLMGRGDHRIAPTFKRWARHEAKAGMATLVLDLEACQGLDSTFLGTIASLVFWLEDHDSRLVITHADERCLRILQRMGMDQLTEVHPDQGPFQQLQPRLDAALQEYRSSLALSRSDRTRFALEAHRELQKTSEENQLRFADVIELLEQELERDS